MNRWVETPYGPVRQDWVSRGYGAVASRMGGRGSTAGRGLVAELGGRGMGEAVYGFGTGCPRSAYGAGPLVVALPWAASVGPGALAAGATATTTAVAMTWQAGVRLGQTLAAVESDALPWTEQGDAWKLENEQIQEALRAAGYRTDGKCTWFLSVAGQQMRLAQVTERVLTQKVGKLTGKTHADIRAEIHEALQRATRRVTVETHAQGNSLTTLLKQTRPDLIASLSGTILFQSGLFLGAFLVEISGFYAAWIDDILGAYFDELFGCIRDLKRSWKRTALGEAFTRLGRFFWSERGLLGILMRNLRLTRWIGVLWLGQYVVAAINETLGILDESSALDLVFSWTFLERLLVHGRNVLDLVADRSAWWSAKGLDAWLEREDIPGVREIAPGEVPATTYRVYIRLSPGAPYTALPERVQFEPGPWQYRLACTKGQCSWSVTPFSKNISFEPRPVPLQVTNTGVYPVWIHVFDAAEKSNAAPRHSGTISLEDDGEDTFDDGPLPSGEISLDDEKGDLSVQGEQIRTLGAPGTGQWAAAGKSIMLTSVETGRSYGPGDVPAGRYEVSIQGQPVSDGQGGVWIVTIRAGLGYVYDCREGQCAFFAEKRL